jgi:hypothetical protein
MVLPTEYELNVTGSSGEIYRGIFKIKPQLTYRDTLRMDQKRRELVGGNAEFPSIDAQNISHVMAKISAHLVVSESSPFPCWWKDSNNGLDLVDSEPIEALYNKVAEVEGEYIKKIKEKAKG